MRFNNPSHQPHILRAADWWRHRTGAALPGTSLEGAVGTRSANGAALGWLSQHWLVTGHSDGDMTRKGQQHSGVRSTETHLTVTQIYICFLSSFCFPVPPVTSPP